MSDDDVREFPNPYPNFDPSLSVLQDVGDNKLKADVVDKLRSNVTKLLKLLEENLASERDNRDNSVYTGTAGFALLYFHLYNVLNDEAFLSLSKHYSDLSTRNLKSHRVTFLCGDAGPLAIAAVIYNKLNRENDAKHFVTKLECLHRQVIDLESDLPDEVLYGRAGYLYSLLFIQYHLGKSAVQEEIIKKVISCIFTSGIRLSQAENHGDCPLFYKWHGKPYIGAAHGIIGILYTLLLATDYVSKDELERYVLPTLEFVSGLKFKSGNFPSSLGSNSNDKLIHWCHGAPGAIHLFLKAYQVFKNEKYLKIAKECSNVIWNRGILRKGYGICHGVAGNAYAFLALFQLTKDESYLYKAIKFSDWCCDYGKHGCPMADRPLSLFEGLAGTIYFMADTLYPHNAAFPAFSLP